MKTAIIVIVCLALILVFFLVGIKTAQPDPEEKREDDLDGSDGDPGAPGIPPVPEPPDEEPPNTNPPGAKGNT